MSATLSVTSRHAPLLEQAVLECAGQSLTGLLEISSVEAGLHTAGWLSGGLDGELTAAAAAKRDVEVIPLSRLRPRDCS